ncbi:MAG: hypothetical protein SU899_00965, partial [Chloroflexota bacterium]|nr:hypothetical protein [Chloroflexota bacterium]
KESTFGFHLNLGYFHDFLDCLHSYLFAFFSYFGYNLVFNEWPADRQWEVFKEIMVGGAR